jgi:hypothetical protein
MAERWDEWEKRNLIIKMRVHCRVITILKALLTLQARRNLITVGISISILRLRRSLQASDLNYESEASSFILLFLRENAVLFYHNIRSVQCRFMIQ